MTETLTLTPEKATTPSRTLRRRGSERGRAGAEEVNASGHTGVAEDQRGADCGISTHKSDSALVGERRVRAGELAADLRAEEPFDLDPRARADLLQPRAALADHDRLLAVALDQHRGHNPHQTTRADGAL